jgi:hypothetical protein
MISKIVKPLLNRVSLLLSLDAKLRPGILCSAGSSVFCSVLCSAGSSVFCSVLCSAGSSACHLEKYETIFE